MGKKKKSQNSNTPVPLGDSSESESSKDSTQAAEGIKTICPHLSKSIELTQLRKSLKVNKEKNDDLICVICKRTNKTSPCQDSWICLRCGLCNCGPSEQDHREDHYKAPRSDTHYVAFQVSSNIIWCFKCEQEIPMDVNKKVQSCAELIKKSCIDQLPFSPVKVDPDNKLTNGTNSNDYLKPESLLCKPFQNLSLNNNEVKPVLNLPKVRGLMNLGNTCFFNSVLQCLAQTPDLVALLREMEVPGEKFHLELDGVTIDTVLEKQLEKNMQVTLSEQLAQILTEVSGVKGSEAGDARTGSFAVNPRLLLSALTSKCPQFEGGDQHDAHELLRHMLDTVHMEDLRRYQKAILSHIGYDKIKRLDELEDSKKQFGKRLNQKVCDTISIRPDQIFKGSLVSILQCTVCKHISKREEPFLDLSLPVAQEKDKPPSLGKKKPNCNSPVEEEDKGAEASSSKHQKSKSRRSHKQQRASGLVYGPENQPGQEEQTTIEEEDKKDSLDADQSDADVEDNEDNACDERHNKAEIVESGYSSEKQMSARGSPITTQSPEEKSKPSSEVASAVFQGCQPKLEASNDSTTEPNKTDITFDFKSDTDTATRPIQELTVTIPEETNTECTSQDSVRVNASNNSPNVSSDSQHGSYRNHEDLLQGDFKLPDNSDSQADRAAMVFEWNCTGDIESRSQESLSVSLQCGLDSSQEMNISPKEGNLSETQSNDNMSICTSIPQSNDNMSVCNSLPENVSIILNSPTKSPKDESGSDERHELRMESETSRILKSRSSPVDMEETTRLDSGLLKLSLEGIPLVHSMDEPERQSPRNWADKAEIIESPKNIEEAEPLMASKSPIPLAPPMPLFTAPCSLDLTKAPQPQPVVQRSSYMNVPHNKYRFEEGECSLQSCLNQFTLIEVLFGANKVGCEACTERHNKGKEGGKTVYQNSTKQLLISKLPPVVIFHLKRFQVQRFSFRKISKHVDFPLILDISQFCTDENKKGPILYSLYGVVEHSGTLHGGHYVAYVKVRSRADASPGQAPPGKWYYISDSRVSDIDESSVLKTQAYLLFYERIP